MNIFAYDKCPVQSALWLDDVRKNKMIVESCQLLSTTVRHLFGDTFSGVYKTSFFNHPCAIWARESHGNYSWLLSYTLALHSQRQRPHKASSLFRDLTYVRDECGRVWGNSQELTPFVNCARNQELGVDFTHIQNTNAAYRLYSSWRWQHDTIKLTWKHGVEPCWRI